MALHNVWVRTLSDGLIRADQIVGIGTHATPEIAGKPPHWLLDIRLATPTGSGSSDGWIVSMLHRTVIQTPAEPAAAPDALARLLAALNAADVAGIIEPMVADKPGNSSRHSMVRFNFTPFPDTQVPAGADPLNGGGEPAIPAN